MKSCNQPQAETNSVTHGEPDTFSDPVGISSALRESCGMEVSISRIGFWAALVAFVGAVGYVASVPLQILNVVSPLEDSAIAFGFSLIIPTPFLLAMLVLHHTVREEVLDSCGGSLCSHIHSLLHYELRCPVDNRDSGRVLLDL